MHKLTRVAALWMRQHAAELAAFDLPATEGSVTQMGMTFAMTDEGFKEVDPFDRIEGVVHMGRIVHGEHDAGDDQDDQHDPGERPEIPPVIQVFRRRVFMKLVLHEAEDRQPVIDPVLGLFDHAGLAVRRRCLGGLAGRGHGGSLR